MRLRPSIVAVGFVVLFAVIANLSWATAVTTTGPWFDVTVSLTVYAVAIGLASVLAVVLVLHASARVAGLDAALRRMDRRIAILRAAPKGTAAHESVHVVSVPRDPDADLGAGPDAFASGGSPRLVDLEKEGHDTLVPLLQAGRPATPAARTEVLRLLVRERVALREERAATWATAAGPALLSVLFLVIAGPMLPGSGGFAAAHYALNTTLILFLSYGFAPLVAWAVISLGMMGPRERAPDRSA